MNKRSNLGINKKHTLDGKYVCPRGHVPLKANFPTDDGVSIAAMDASIMQACYLCVQRHSTITNRYAAHAKP